MQKLVGAAPPQRKDLLAVWPGKVALWLASPCPCCWLSSECVAPSSSSCLRDMAMNRIFRCFRIIQVSIDPLHYLSSRSDFGFEFAVIIEIPDSVSRGVADSPHRWVESVSRGVGYWIFKRKLPISVSRRVVNSPHRWYGESPTPCMDESASRYLIKFYNMKKKSLDLYLCVPVVAGIPCPCCCWSLMLLACCCMHPCFCSVNAVDNTIALLVLFWVFLLQPASQLLLASCFCCYPAVGSFPFVQNIHPWYIAH
jgi:hypothetical protein